MPTRYSVSVYERAGSPYWWARVYLAGGGDKPLRESTRVPIGDNRRQSEKDAARAAERIAARLAGEHQEQRRSAQGTAWESVALRMLDGKKADGRRDRAVEGLEFWLDKHVTPFLLPDRDIRTIRRADLEALKAELRSKGLAPTSINNALTAARQVLKHACLVEEMIEAVPAVANVRVSPESKGRLLTEEEYSALINALDPRYPEARDWLMFVANTGLRKSEALAIRWDWIDWAAKVVRVPAEYRKGGKKQIAPTPLNKQALAILRRRRKQTRQPSLGRVFWQESHDGARNSAAARAGLGRVRTHDLRHTLGSRMYAKGASLPEVRDMLGHSTLTMVSRYAHSYPERLQEMANRAGMSVSGSVTGGRQKSTKSARKRQGGKSAAVEKAK